LVKGLSPLLAGLAQRHGIELGDIFIFQDISVLKVKSAPRLDAALDLLTDPTSSIACKALAVAAFVFLSAKPVRLFYLLYLNI
jgi:hypothetical protein